MQQLGPARTSIYSNAIPLVAMITAAILLGEPITGSKLIGVAAVLAGVVLDENARSRGAACLSRASKSSG